jgi:hypothetical protein
MSISSSANAAIAMRMAMTSMASTLERGPSQPYDNSPPRRDDFVTAAR